MENPFLHDRPSSPSRPAPLASSSARPPGFSLTTLSTGEAQTACPKCGWFCPAAAESCPACGIVFAKFLARRAASSSSTIVQGGIPREAAARRHMPHTTSSAEKTRAVVVHADVARTLKIGDTVKLAFANVYEESFHLVALWILPALLTAGLVFAGSVGMVAVVAFARSPTGFAVAALGVLVVGFFALKLYAAAYAGSLIALSRSAEETGYALLRPDGIDLFARGWQRATKLIALSFVMALMFGAPLSLASSLSLVDSRLALVAMALVLPIAVWLGLRLSLAVPALVVGGEGVLAAIAESHRMTRGVLPRLVVVYAIGVVGSLVLFGIGAWLAEVVPYVGFAVGGLVGVFAQAVTSAHVVAAYRALAD